MPDEIKTLVELRGNFPVNPDSGSLLARIIIAQVMFLQHAALRWFSAGRGITRDASWPQQVSTPHGG